MSHSHTTPPADHHVPEVSPVESNALGVEFAMELGSLIAVPAVVFGLVGRLIDKQLGDSHLFFFLGLVLAFAGSFTAIFRKIKVITDRMPKVVPKKKTKENKEEADPEIAKEQEILHELFRPPSVK